MNPAKQKNWKLLTDPLIIKGAVKLFRYEGQVQGDPTYPAVHVRDPRSQIQRLWSRPEVLDLPVPRFRIDAEYIGDPPSVEVTICNVNDNIDKVFLGDLVKKHGPFEELQIFYHPKTNKHLGLARVIFENVKNAKACVEKLNQTSVMGRPLQVFLDPFGAECKKLFETLTTEKKPEVKPEIKKIENKPSEEPETVVPVPPLQVIQREKSSSQLQTTNNLESEEHYFNSNGHAGVEGSYNFPPPSFSVPPPTADFYGGWHQQFWNTSAPSWVTQPPPEAALANSNHEEEKKEEEPLVLDLDSRIELLLKGKISAALNTPAFLQLHLDGSSNSGSSRSSSRAADHDNKNVDPCSSPPLSPPPSPFLSQEIYFEYYKAAHPEPPQAPRLSGEILNDEMSLSSLSSGDEKIFNSDGTKIEIDDQNAGGPSFSHFFPPPPNYSSSDPYFAWRGMYGNAYNQSAAFASGTNNAAYPNFNYPPPNGYPPLVDVAQSTASTMQNNAQLEQGAEDPHAATIEEVVDRIVAELKQILKKDFNRRMVEGTAFKAFENWWDEQSKQETKGPLTKPNSLNSITSALQQPGQPPQSVAQTSEQQPQAATKKVSLGFEGLNFGFGLGLGLRASMPKLPSFRRKIRPPSPPPMDGDSRRRLQDSDDESRDTRNDRRYNQRGRGSLRSLYSSSSSSSSSSSDDEDLEDRHRKRNRRQRGSVSFSSSSSSSDDRSHSDSDSISGAESISEGSLPDSPRPMANKTSRTETCLELEEVSPDRPPTPGTPDIREEPEDRLSHLIDQAKEKEDSDSSTSSSASFVYKDHCYSLPPKEEPPDEKGSSASPSPKREDHLYDRVKSEKITKVPSKLKNAEALKKKQSKREAKRIRDSTTPDPVLPIKKTFAPRDMIEEMSYFYEFLAKGIDAEDISYFHKSYENLLSQDALQTQGYWLNDTHWVDYDPTEMDPSPSKRKRKEEPRPHKSGSARTEGYYKLDSKEKAKHKSHFARCVTEDSRLLEANVSSVRTAGLGPTDTGNKGQALSREARSNQRRLLTAFGLENDSDLLKFNQLKFRGAKLKFGKSSIHDWGLFAVESIAADEMVIEYVGQVVRPVLADLRETQYEAVGIGSSYLFRVDLEYIIDATKCGNLARFINHSCNPNCYARVITIESQKKIVIYSKQPIGVGEEITYDYKFPIEEDKIVCLCGSSQCRGTLN